MKIKKIQITFVAVIALSIFSSLFVGDVSQVRAQSSRVWSDPVNLSNSGSASNPVFIVDTLGMMHAFWIDSFDGYRYVQSADGKAWTSPQTVKYPFNTEGTLPKLVTGPKGFIYVFFQSKDTSLRFAQAHSDTLAEPTGWGYQIQLSNDVLAYDVALDPQGGLHVAYIRNKDGTLGSAGVYYVRSTDGGRSWSKEKLLYESPYFRTAKSETAHIRVVVSDEADNGRVYVIWDNISLKRIFMSTSTDSGLSWGDAVQMKGPEDTGGYDMPFNG